MTLFRAQVFTVLVGSVALLQCGSQPIDSNDEGSAGSSGSTAGSGGAAAGNGPSSGMAGGGMASGGMNAANPLGSGVGSLALVYQPNVAKRSATALAWNATVAGELWVTLRQFPSGKPCTEADDSGCAALEGVMAVVSDATGPAPKGVLKEDGNSWHFMRRPTSISWGDGELFGACGEAWTDNYEDLDVPYAGPVLWSANPAIFGAKPKAGQNGTHMDMLHETPYCMGIAHETGNAYWAVNGEAGSLDRYDFHTPHQIGGEDHSDGEVYRYIAGELLREPEVPSHAVFDAGLVYVADTGHGRVISMDPSGAVAGDDIDVYEELVGSGERVGAVVTEVVAPGVLQKPSGLALAGNTLYVTDNATSLVYAYDTAGQQLQVFDTMLPAGSLAGVSVGPDGKLYLSDLLTGKVWRIEPGG